MKYGKGYIEIALSYKKQVILLGHLRKGYVCIFTWIDTVYVDSGQCLLTNEIILI